MCVCACFRCVTSSGCPAKSCNADKPFASDCSISDLTQVSGPRSNPASAAWAAVDKIATSGGGSDLEAGDRCTQILRELRELRNRDVGLLGAFGRLLRDLQDALHAPCDIRHGRRLLLRLR